MSLEVHNNVQSGPRKYPSLHYLLFIDPIFDYISAGAFHGVYVYVIQNILMHHCYVTPCCTPGVRRPINRFEKFARLGTSHKMGLDVVLGYGRELF